MTAVYVPLSQIHNVRLGIRRDTQIQVKRLHGHKQKMIVSYYGLSLHTHIYPELAAIFFFFSTID